MCVGSHFGQIRPFWLLIHKIISRSDRYKYRGDFLRVCIYACKVAMNGDPTGEMCTFLTAAMVIFAR